MSKHSLQDPSVFERGFFCNRADLARIIYPSSRNGIIVVSDTRRRFVNIAPNYGDISREQRPKNESLFRFDDLLDSDSFQVVLEDEVYIYLQETSAGDSVAQPLTWWKSMKIYFHPFSKWVVSLLLFKRHLMLCRVRSPWPGRSSTTVGG